MSILKYLTLAVALVLFPLNASATQVRRLEAQEFDRVQKTILSLPGVQDEGHIEDLAKGIVTASAEATCSLDWAHADWCKRTWGGSRLQLQAALITIGYWESRFLARIGRGECRKYECDAYKYKGVIHHRARSYFQVQRTGAVRNSEWHEMTGTDEWSTFVASSVASRILARNLRWCKNVNGMFSGYARGGSCQWKGAGRRTLFFHKIVMPRLKNPPEPPPVVSPQEQKEVEVVVMVQEPRKQTKSF